MSERLAVLALVGGIVVIGVWLAYLGFTSQFGGVQATLSVAALVGALVVLKAYEVWRK